MVFFQTALLGAPRVSDPGRAAFGMARLRESAENSGDPGLVEWTRDLQDDAAARHVLEGIFANSPFLTASILAEVPFLRRVLEAGPDEVICELGADLKDRVSRELDEERLGRELRIAKRRMALTVALADLSGHWLLERVTQALTDFADAAVSAAISHLLLREAAKGDLVLRDERFPEDDSGYVALAMGKHGARELNYSSDIDLIVLYDPQKVEYRGRRTLPEAFIRMTQRLISILQARTADGYVFRVDLNLRPDPSSTPVAVSVAAARTYYATRGQNWERAAMIKARSAAGDTALGVQFLAELSPFIWREHLDFWMIRDIRAIKRRLNAERGGAAVAFHGHNVKLGRGGIREIEFFAQTHQLILGGRDPYLRCLRTVEALTTLAESGAIDEEVTDQLTEAYDLLRQLEHRLQMVDDQQTQTLPDTDEGMGRIAAFMGYDDLETFRGAVLHHLRRVEAHYAAFFADAREVAAPPVPSALARIEAWNRASLPPAADARSRELLTELIPVFVEAAASRPDPDEALLLLQDFLDRLPDAVRTLSLLSANRSVVELLLDVVTTAPALAAELRQWPARLESAVSSSFFLAPPGKKVLGVDAAELWRARPELTLALASAAKWTNEHRFQLAAHVLRQTITDAAAGQAASDLADVVVEQLWRRASGADGAGGLIVLADGSYAARELTPTSRVRLLFVSDHPNGNDEVVARQVIEWLTATTAHGRLYEVDAPDPVLGFDRVSDPSLSPSTRVALTEARVVCGSEAAVARLHEALGTRAVGSVDTRPLAADLGQPRENGSSPWDVRRRRGGLDELDTLVRLLRALTAAGGELPVSALLPFAADRGALEPETVPRLLAARRLLRQVENLLGVALAPGQAVESAPVALRLMLARVAGVADLAELRAAIDAAAETIASALDQVVGAASSAVAGVGGASSV